MTQSTAPSDAALPRRAFVRNSALAVGGLMAAPVALRAGVHQNNDDAIRIGLIGCGGRGTGAAVQALSTQQNVKLVAMADAFRDRLDSSYRNICEQEYKDAAGSSVDVSQRVDVPEEQKFVGFDGYQKVIALSDVLVIATPPGFRPTHFAACVDAGKHVFMEKPVATDGPGVRQVLASAEEAKQKKLNVVVGLQRHYEKSYQEWIKRIHDGAIGDVVATRVYWNGGGLWVRSRQPGDTEMQYQMRNWYYFTWLCGDHIVEQHVHNLDVGNWIKQAYPVRAFGSGGRQVRTGKEHGEIFDHHTVEYEYADGARMFSQCRQIDGCLNRVTEAVHGTKGQGPSPGALDIAGGDSWRHRGRGDGNPYQVEHDELFDAVAKGEYRFSDAENGAKSTLTAIMGRMATYSGRMIEWDDALNSQRRLVPEELSWEALPPVLPNADGYYPVPVPGKTEVL